MFTIFWNNHPKSWRAVFVALFHPSPMKCLLLYYLQLKGISFGWIIPVESIIWSISPWETQLRFALEINNCCCFRSCFVKRFCYSFFRYNYFAFEHSPSYQEVQFLFLDAVESLNPNNISVSKLPLPLCPLPILLLSKLN